MSTQGFQVVRPSPQPTRYMRKFNRQEVCDALREYLLRASIYVPEGDAFLWGLDRSTGRPDDENLTLVIDVSEKPV